MAIVTSISEIDGALRNTSGYPLAVIWSDQTSQAMKGMPYLWKISISARATPLWNSPNAATTFSLWISRSAAVRPSAGMPRVST